MGNLCATESKIENEDFSHLIEYNENSLYHGKLKFPSGDLYIGDFLEGDI